MAGGRPIANLCIIRELAACGLVVLADKCYIGAGKHRCALSTGDGTSLW
jgi:hypothetical protein